MVLRLDPSVPLVWRDPGALQFGVERAPVVVDPIGPADERVIHALRGGAPRGALEVIAAPAGAEGVAAVAALLDRLAPVLEETTAPPRWPAGALVVGSTPLARRISGALGGAIGPGLPPAARGPVGLVLLVHDWAVPPGAAVEWMSRDIPHLPVAAADGTVLIGPVVRPGRTACLYCLHRARADADAAWPAIAAQVHGTPAPPLGALAEVEAAVLTTRVALRALDGDDPAGQLVLDAATGAVSSRDVPPHPDCACGAHPGSGWARDAVRLPTARTRSAPPSSARGAAAPA
jgi:bacteriocin biosynthesis cyclodehydratase domain-containing protein